MDHLTPEHLADRVLGHPDLLTETQMLHLESCPDCRSELDLLSRTAAIAQGGINRPPMMPGPHVWERILADVSADQDPGTAPDAVAPGPVSSPAVLTSVAAPAVTGTLPVRRPRWAVALVAAGLGLVLGVGGAVLVDRIGTQSEVVSSAALDPLPGHTGRGTAELVRTDGSTELRVEVESAAPTDEFRELWLVNTDLKRMYSLGVLPTSGTGTYPVPPQLAGGLEGFTIVDISIEPYDGDALHSRNSLVRGVLPA